MIRITRMVFRATWALAALSWLAGCSALSPYSHLTKLDLTLTATDQLNLDINGRPSPVVVRLFELKHPVAFESSDFFSLYQRPKETLSQDMVASEEHELRPGETLALKLSIDPDSRFVGILAAYRDLDQAHWRRVQAIRAGERVVVNLYLDQAGIHNGVPSVAQAGERP
ncbi:MULTISPECIES: type VI secretion system lipoprotein TssJ [Pseudomonas]|uniref:type VI secretion system lipoprotein TssJ n=1 Tax=Pseudomonas TaxID=286 RepID=UPI001646ADA8|nr:MULTISPECIES: type VI secretion system lipoprotein TssJ [Pseudomonas]QXI48358.1 type VI secretion system lipoprotein TssJ [Pseudomonas anuradhapurensis]